MHIFLSISVLSLFLSIYMGWVRCIQRFIQLHIPMCTMFKWSMNYHSNPHHCAQNYSSAPFLKSFLQDLYPKNHWLWSVLTLHQSTLCAVFSMPPQLYYYIFDGPAYHLLYVLHDRTILIVSSICQIKKKFHITCPSHIFILYCLFFHDVH